MSAPTNAPWRSGAIVKPEDDSTAYGGTPGSELVDSSQNLLFDATPANPIGGADIVHYNSTSRHNEEGDGGQMLSPKVILMNGMRLTSSSGVIGIQASAADAGKKMVCSGFNSGTLVQETIELIAGTVSGSAFFGANDFWRGELVQSDGVTPTTAAEPITLSVGGTNVAVMQGPINDGFTTTSFGQVTAEYAAAVATAKNLPIGNTSRLNPPDDAGAFLRAVKFSGVDLSLSCPDLDDTEYICIAFEKTIKAGMPSPLSGEVDIIHNFQFIGAA